MGKKLIIAEKPSLAVIIANALGIKSKNKNGSFEGTSNGEEIIIASLVGHILKKEYEKQRWTKENLPVNMENFKIIVDSSKKDVYQRVKNEITRSDIDEIISAGDADEEGSLLVYEVLEYTNILKNKNIAFTRMWIIAEDEPSLRKIYKDRFDINKNMKWVNSAKARGDADAAIGFNFSQLFTLLNNKSNELLSIGRVMTPTLAIVRQREEEIENFVPMDFYLLKGDFEKNLKGMECVVLSKEEEIIEDENNEEENKQIVDKWQTRIPVDQIKEIKEKIEKDKAFKVIETKEETKNIKPELLPNLSDVLKACGKKFKFSTQKTTDIMQFLYENHYCTYPRSESTFLQTTMLPDIEKTLDIYSNFYHNELNGETTHFSEKNNRIFNNDKAKEHHAIIPRPKNKADIAKLNNDQNKVFEYIVSKFLMAAMKDYIYNSSTIILENKYEIRFRTNGKIEKSKGFKALKLSTMSEAKEKKDVVLPNIAKGEQLQLLKYKEERKTTQPPELLTEPDVLEFMGNIHKLYKKQIERVDGESDDLEENENEKDELFEEKFSLGTSATRNGIFKKLYERELWKSVEKGRLKVTEKGLKTITAVKNTLDVKTTAKFEKRMKEIKEEKITHIQFKKEIETWVNNIVNNLKENIKETTTSAQEKILTSISCPNCKKGNLMDTGKSFRCSEAGTWDGKNQKWSGKCSFQILKDQDKFLGKILSETDIISLIDGKTLIGKNETKLTLDLKNPPFYTKMEFSNSNGNNNGGQTYQKIEPNKNGIIVGEKYFKKDDILVWKEISGRKMSEQEAIKLFNGETLEFNDFVSKTGSKYTTKITIDKKEKKVIFLR
jgi:DNA topoisomerase-3